MYTVPNQQKILIHREMPKSDFLQIKNENWQQMIKETKDYYAFVLYLYFASNANDYNLALSPAAITEATGLARSTYYKKMEFLKEKGYIVEGKGNQLHFYEVPQKTRSEEEIENNNCGGLSHRQENLAGRNENLGQRKGNYSQEQNSSSQNIEIYNRYNKYQDKIIQTLVGLDSEEAAPPKPATFEF